MNVTKLIDALPGEGPEARLRMRANAETWLQSSDARKIAAAKELIAAIDEVEIRDAAEFERTPLRDRVVKAFTRKPWTDHERKLIESLLNNPGSTTTELNGHAGLGEDNKVWQMHFGNMCKDRSGDLGPAPNAVTREGQFWSGLLADADGDNRFTMKPDAVAGFAQLGLKAAR